MQWTHKWIKWQCLLPTNSDKFFSQNINTKDITCALFDALHCVLNLSVRSNYQGVACASIFAKDCTSYSIIHRIFATLRPNMMLSGNEIVGGGDSNVDFSNIRQMRETSCRWGCFVTGNNSQAPTPGDMFIQSTHRVS